MGTASIVKSLAPAMIQEAESFLSDRLHGTSVAEMYLSRHRGDEAECGGLARRFAAMPRSSHPGVGRIRHDNFLTLVSLPNDEHGLELKKWSANSARTPKCC